MNSFCKIALGSLALTLASVGMAEAAEGWARSSSWLRAGPGTSYPALTRVAAGEAVDVHGCTRRWTWCDISVDGERGWFPGDRIALLRDGRRTALPGAAAVLGLAILGFERNLYWGEHYRGRSFGEHRDRAEPVHRFRAPPERPVVMPGPPHRERVAPAEPRPPRAEPRHDGGRPGPAHAPAGGLAPICRSGSDCR